MSKRHSFQHIREEKDERPILHTPESKPDMIGRNGKEEEKKPKNGANRSKSSALTTPTMTPIDDFTMYAMQTIRSSVLLAHDRKQKKSSTNSDNSCEIPSSWKCLRRKR